MPVDAAPHALSARWTYPVVLKPLALSGSRGVMRADNREAFEVAFARLRHLLHRADVRIERDDAHEHVLVESFIPGREYAVEGVLTHGAFTPFAIFDKPDPLDGPFFEETIYVTPSRASAAVQSAVISTVGAAARALGLSHGPVHAFYLDRGFPDARVRSFDVQLNDAQDEVRVTVDITEGEPIRVAAIEMNGFDVLSEAQLRSLRESLPLRQDMPLDRQLAVATRDRALNTLKDEGYPYATVGMSSEDVSPKRQRIRLDATPGTLAHIGEIDIRGEKSVGENVVRRQLSFKTGDRYTRKELRESQRKLYGLELFEFANVESLEDKDVMGAR